MYGTKLQKWEQITTPSERAWRAHAAVMYGTKLQKWEQITTSSAIGWKSVLLWCMVQSYKNESKSQQYYKDMDLSVCCDVWYKVTKMRANHNDKGGIGQGTVAVMYGTKLQKWEQITTQCINILLFTSCDVWYKVTKMRANHNSSMCCKTLTKAVMYGTKLQKWEQITTGMFVIVFPIVLWCMVQSYKNESKSQQPLYYG